jgi:hypothetical protein
VDLIAVPAIGAVSSVFPGLLFWCRSDPNPPWVVVNDILKMSGDSPQGPSGIDLNA